MRIDDVGIEPPDPRHGGSGGQRWPNCRVELRTWIEGVLDEIAEELGKNLVGIYLHGSLASGSFYEPKSDVDVLLVVRGPLGDSARESFVRRCKKISQSRPLIGDLECSVVLERWVLSVSHPTPIEVQYPETTSLTSSDLAVHCQAILESGIRLRGELISRLFGPVDKADFEDSMMGDVQWILEEENIIETPFYGVLNLCRALWVWSGHSQRLAPSKEEAGKWALGYVSEPLRVVVEDALRAYRDPSPVTPETRKTAGRTWNRASLLEFRDHVRSIVDRSRQP